MNPGDRVRLIELDQWPISLVTHLAERQIGVGAEGKVLECGKPFPLIHVQFDGDDTPLWLSPTRFEKV